MQSDPMEISTTFWFLIGIIFVVTLIMVGIAISGSLMAASDTLHVTRCTEYPTYTAHLSSSLTTLFIVECGTKSIGMVKLHYACDGDDTCVDENNHKCCDTSSSNIKAVGSHCCIEE